MPLHVHDTLNFVCYADQVKPVAEMDEFKETATDQEGQMYWYTSAPSLQQIFI